MSFSYLVKMMRVLLILSVVMAAAFGSVSFVRTREEIEGFKKFLDDAVPSAAVVQRNAILFPEADINEISGLFQGDILLNEDQKEELLENFATGNLPSTRHGVTQIRAVWPNHTLIYEIVEEHFQQVHIDFIDRALAEISAKSCLSEQ